MPHVKTQADDAGEQADDVDEEQHDREAEELPAVPAGDVGGSLQRLRDTHVVAALGDHEAVEAEDDGEDDAGHDEEDRSRCRTPMPNRIDARMYGP